ncbi:helix-turn-helix domain-containing protein [Lacticaseibacillus sharpeae]|uniref:HTH cro/C1-type domain-containing protein n=1 Tax=Lacticaseibacillus sharpeae JCM 1186 = DSM 20505 TaxID=1291052 RepID=A0A0R1ZN86_9LACO|nr:helix-turn-helix transcriptional regulator [Lacticaseibacillus sharpeae]KRM54596.1 hypothetical protein FC18_GL002303 [Lacticaseibacillus sharpeae JCM 1186 = DSM 20505]
MATNILGPTIRALRKEKGLTQKDLSNLTGIAQNTISNHENQNRSLDENDIRIYANALSVQVQDLYNMAEAMATKNQQMREINERQTSIDHIYSILPQLNSDHVKSVEEFATKQLTDQHETSKLVKPFSTLNEPTAEYTYDEPELLAAHIDDDATPEEREAIMEWARNRKRLRNKKD